MPEKAISIGALRQLRKAKLIIEYELLLTFYKGRDVFIIGDKPSKKIIPVNTLSRYTTGFKSKSNLFTEHGSGLAPGSKVIRIGYMIFLGAEMYAVDDAGQIYKHTERTGCIDMKITPGLRVREVWPQEESYNRRNRRLSVLK